MQLLCKFSPHHSIPPKKQTQVRHLSNVFQGLLMSSPDIVNTPAKWAKLWLHESERVYADRLVSQAVSRGAQLCSSAQLRGREREDVCWCVLPLIHHPKPPKRPHRTLTPTTNQLW
jgi:hypothetical protein